MPTAGMVAPQEPLQTNSLVKKPFFIKKYLIEPVATYDITARVLLTDRYRFSDGADLVPIDFTLGWGKMSDSGVFSHISLGHGFHDFWWYMSAQQQAEANISTQEIIEHSANTHLIPVDNYVAGKLFQIHQYDVVRLQGYLVNVSRNDSTNWHWATSTTRTDSGDGACELMLVENIKKFE